MVSCYIAFPGYLRIHNKQKSQKCKECWPESSERLQTAKNISVYASPGIFFCGRSSAFFHIVTSRLPSGSRPFFCSILSSSMTQPKAIVIFFLSPHLL
jgi:hypothetical protein